MLGFQVLDEERVLHMGPAFKPRSLIENPSAFQLDLDLESGRFTDAELDCLR